MKTTPDELVEAIADDFNTYIGRGIQLGPFTDEIDPNLNIDNIEKLLRIHFVLTETDSHSPGVIDFIDALPDRLRRLKTTVTQNTRTLQGEVRGRIDWQQTVKERYRANPHDQTRFACNETQKNYAIPENLVLKELLSIIHKIVSTDLEPALEHPSTYEWLGAWTDHEQDLARVLNEAVRKNVYLQRINSEEARITERMIRSVGQSRTPLYQEAATLLDQYRQLMEYELEADEARTLLQRTFIAPDQTSVLFELYWVFRILDTYENVRFKLLDGPRNMVATWENDDWQYALYHDSTGANLQFSEDATTVVPPTDDGYLYRKAAILKHWLKLSETLLDFSGSDRLWGGRPDILIEKSPLGENSVEEVFIGEVKYTNRRSYAAKGLRELLEYMAFVKSNGEYIERQDDLLDSVRVQGLLCVDQIEGIAPPDSQQITVKQFGESIERPL